MTRETPPVFVERRTYRRRRVADAARLLPLLGAGLFLVPLLWGSAPDQPARTTTVMVYVFGVWIVLTVCSAVLSRHLRPGESKRRRDGGAG